MYFIVRCLEYVDLNVIDIVNAVFSNSFSIEYLNISDVVHVCFVWQWAFYLFIMSVYAELWVWKYEALAL